MNELADYIQLYQLKMVQHAKVTRPWNLHKLGRDKGRQAGICVLELVSEKPTLGEITEDYPIYESYLNEDGARLGRFKKFELELGHVVSFIDLTLEGGNCILLTADLPEWFERDNPRGVVAIYRGYDWNIYVALESWLAMQIDDSGLENCNTCIQISSETETGGYGIYKLKIKKEE